jgi:cellulose synthase/poly-beta-1,6-N-acetylglucosamine synthase-like glycosyltransferase
MNRSESRSWLLIFQLNSMIHKDFLSHLTFAFREACVTDTLFAAMSFSGCFGRYFVRRQRYFLTVLRHPAARTMDGAKRNTSFF